VEILFRVGLVGAVANGRGLAANSAAALMSSSVTDAGTLKWPAPGANSAPRHAFESVNARSSIRHSWAMVLGLARRRLSGQNV
tara:strand:- start:403 stop:651 length:249 start_codon:yes stop_codon:yes gene_type:complete